MKSFVRPMLLIAGLLSFVGGIVLMILGKLAAVFLVLLGFGLMAGYFSLMLHTGGYRVEEGFLFHYAGVGRQQSEVSKDPDAWKGTQNGSIWDRMNGNQE